MGVLILAMEASLNALEPFVFQELLHGDACFRVGVQDSLHQLAASDWQLLEWFVVVDASHVDKELVVWVLSDSGTEWNALVNHAIVDNATSPDVDTAGIVLLGLEFFGCDVRLRPTETLGKVWSLFPAHAEHIRDSKVGDLETTLAVEQQIFGLDVTMSDTHGMKVSDAVDQLLKAAIDLCS